MANIPHFLGDVRKGDRVQFPIEWFYDLHHELETDVEPGWAALTYDVLDNDTKIYLKQGLAIDVATDSPLGNMGWVDLVLEDEFDSDGNRTLTWTEGQSYTIIIRGSELTDRPWRTFFITFRVEPAQRQAFAGTVEKGQVFYFMHREENRSAMWFDVIDPKNQNVVSADNVMTQSGTTDFAVGGNNSWIGSIPSEGTDDLSIGRTYWIRVKDETGDDPQLTALYSFSVLPRLQWSLKRLLGLGGENMVLDNFSYDQAGNITGLRVRLFEESQDADNATSGVTDPEPGEIASYTVTQEHEIPRNVRTFHKSIAEFISTTFPKDV